MPPPLSKFGIVQCFSPDPDLSGLIPENLVLPVQEFQVVKIPVGTAYMFNDDDTVHISDGLPFGIVKEVSTLRFQERTTLQIMSR